ncbi:MAG: VOC family protein [Pseudomonadota bacterium]
MTTVQLIRINRIADLDHLMEVEQLEEELSGNVKWPFTNFHHVHTAAKDIKVAHDFLKPLGIHLEGYNHPGVFKVSENIDEDEFWARDYKFCRTGAAHMQFMSPHKPGRYQNFLDTYGNRVYSLGFVVDDVDKAEAALLERGLTIRTKGRHEDGWGFTYFDTFDTLGVLLCIRQSAENEATSQDNVSEGAFKTLHHVHIIVDDMEEVSNFLQGIGIEVRNYQHPGGFELLEGIDEDAFWKLGYKHAVCGDVHLQIMSPAEEDTGHKRFVAQHKRRVFSLGFVVDNLDAEESFVKSKGLNVLMKGRHQDGWGFTYFDTFDQLGFNLCIRTNPRG